MISTYRSTSTRTTKPSDDLARSTSRRLDLALCPGQTGHSPKRQCGPVVTMPILSLGHVWRLGGVGLSIVPPFPPLSIVDVDCPLSPCPATPTTKQQKQPQGKYEGKSIWHFHVLEFNEAIISSKPSRHLEASCSKPYTGQLVDACPHHHPTVGSPSFSAASAYSPFTASKVTHRRRH